MKGIATIGLILIGILVIGAGTVLVTQGIIPLEVAGGIAPLSLSQASFQSSNPFFNEKLWILTVTQGGIGAKAIGEIDNTDVGTKTGQTPKTDLSIDITYSKQSCEYPISNAGTDNVITLTRSEWTCAFGPSAQEASQHNCPNLLFYGKYGESFTCYCIGSVTQTGAIAYNTINNPNVHTVSTIKVSTGDGKVETGTVDTQNVIANYLGTNVYVQWNGDLLKNACPSQNPWVGLYKGGAWIIGNRNSYESYRNYKNSVPAVMAGGITKATADSIINAWNDKASAALIPYIFGGTIQDSAFVSGAKIIVDLKSAATNPVYTFYVKANWLGFLVPQPKPILVDATGTTITAGEGSALSITYRNDGDAGNVDVTTTCDSGVSVSQNTQTFSIAKGQTKTSLVSINGDINQNTKKQCEICVYPNPRDNSQPRQCKVVDVFLKPQHVCNADTYSCAGRDIYKCNAFGSSNDKITTCAEGQQCFINPQGVGTCSVLVGQECQLDSDCSDNDARTIDKCVPAGILGERKCSHDVPNPVCGDGQCDSRESKESCPKDCGVIPPPPGTDLLPFIFLGVVAAVAALLVIWKKKRK